ncbi:MAG TPA: hypothetical protein VFX97_16750 [Pyrinomonadaceae bacterium]|nr:hypothetical protein [Pyrinomonadaceae bacterium]
MNRIKRKIAALALASVLIVQTACGGNVLTTVRLALASSGPLVNSLVAAGVLKQEQAGPIITDFTDGSNVALTLQTDFKACAKDRPCKLRAAQKAETGFRAIINRQHFAANPRVQQIADIASGILSSLVIFYGGTSPNATVMVAMDAGPPLTDDQIEARVKPDADKLKQLMKMDK